jgi:hypothetical protein
VASRLVSAAGLGVIVAGIAFMILGVALALEGRIYASLLSSASGATALLVGADLVRSEG